MYLVIEKKIHTKHIKSKYYKINILTQKLEFLHSVIIIIWELIHSLTIVKTSVLSWIGEIYSKSAYIIILLKNEFKETLEVYIEHWME